MSPEQYIESGNQHTANDEVIDWRTVKKMQSNVNNVVWWMNKILRHGEETDESRVMKNMQDNNNELADMYCLIKDHKHWSSDSKMPVPSRPVVSGNETFNVHLSEILSELIEPVTRETSSVETVSTEEALCHINKLNDHIERGNSIDTLDGLLLCEDRPIMSNSAEENGGQSTGATNSEKFILSDYNLNESDSGTLDVLCGLAESARTNLDNGNPSIIIDSQTGTDVIVIAPETDNGDPGATLDTLTGSNVIVIDPVDERYPPRF